MQNVVPVNMFCNKMLQTGGSSHFGQDGLRCSVVQVVQVVEVVQMIKVVRTVWVVSLDDMCSENICLTWFTIKFLRKVEMSVT